VMKRGYTSPSVSFVKNNKTPLDDSKETRPTQVVVHPSRNKMSKKQRHPSLKCRIASGAK
jgi:hypothetical protein